GRPHAGVTVAPRRLYAAGQAQLAQGAFERAQVAVQIALDVRCRACAGWSAGAQPQKGIPDAPARAVVGDVAAALGVEDREGRGGRGQNVALRELAPSNGEYVGVLAEQEQVRQLLAGAALDQLQLQLPGGLVIDAAEVDRPARRDGQR